MVKMDLTDRGLKRRLESDLERCRETLVGIPLYSDMYMRWMVCAEKVSLESMIVDCKSTQTPVPEWVKIKLGKIESSNDWLS